MITNTTAVAYMRASTKEQDATRAREEITLFAKENGITIRGFYVENVYAIPWSDRNSTGYREEASPHDIIRREARSPQSPQRRGVEPPERTHPNQAPPHRLPRHTDHPRRPAGRPAGGRGGFDVRRVVLDAMNDMLLDIAAAWARDDYETRRKRQQQGIEKAKKLGRFKGKQKDEELRSKIRTLLDTGSMSQNQIANSIGCSRNTVSRVARGE